jgi:hypothetical protein
VYTISVGKRLIVPVFAVWGDDIKIVINGNGYEEVRWVELAQNRVYWWALKFVRESTF